MFFVLKISFALLLLFAFIACGSDNAIEGKAPQELFEQGVELFEDEDYINAQKYFDIIKLQYPVSQFVDDAQYYIAESDFMREKYITAAFNYELLRKIYPSSEHAKTALFKRALCYYHLSPAYDRDQDYTKKAISAFQEFQQVYRSDSLYQQASAYINELRSKLAEKEFATAELYLKLENPKSAVIYYDMVISDYDDTQYYEAAFWGKIRCLEMMRKYEAAKAQIEFYRKRFPEGRYTEAVISAGNRIDLLLK